MSSSAYCLRAALYGNIANLHCLTPPCCVWLSRAIQHPEGGCHLGFSGSNVYAPSNDQDWLWQLPPAEPGDLQLPALAQNSASDWAQWAFEQRPRQQELPASDLQMAGGYSNR